VQLEAGLLANGGLGAKSGGGDKAGGNSNHSRERAHCQKGLRFAKSVSRNAIRRRSAYKVNFVSTYTKTPRL
jgi:hypothetical protein